MTEDTTKEEMNETKKDMYLTSPMTGVIIRQHGQNPVTPDAKILDYSVVLDDEPSGKRSCS